MDLLQVCRLFDKCLFVMKLFSQTGLVQFPFFHNVAFKDTTTLGRAQHELCLGLRACSFYTTYIKNGFLFEIVLSLRYILLHVKHFHIINEHVYINCLLV